MATAKIVTNRDRGRFDRFNIVVPVLLAGWVPSILMLAVSYTILRDTLESKILRDRQTFVQLIGHMVGDDLSRTSGIIGYYGTLPEAARILTTPNPTFAQQWLNAAFYSHPRIDGMFMMAPDGRLLASVPPDPANIGKDFESPEWRAIAQQSKEPYVSPIHPRLIDKRLATDIVTPVRTPDGNVVGYLGVSVLVERIGRRLSSIEFADQQVCEIVDQNGIAFSANELRSGAEPTSWGGPNLVKEIGHSRNGYLERNGNLYSFSPVESTDWLAIVLQPRAVAYKPVRELLNKATLLVGWLLLATAAAAWLAGKLYKRHSESTRRLEREVTFNEKILANMPTGIAFVDPATREFVQANEAFAQMARRFGGFPLRREITDASYDEVQIAPREAIEGVLQFGTPFQLIEHPFADTGGMIHYVNITLLRLQGSHSTVQGVLYLVDDRTRDVTLRQELISANAAKDQFLALLSHELRNPLSPVIAMVAELEATTPDTPQTREALEVIRRNVELEARLIDDLLDVTRIAKGKLQLTFEVVSVHEILHRAYEICREEILNKHLHVEFDLQAALPFVEADPARLQQVFWNLIKNSVKFTPPAGHVRIETSNPAADEILVRITDTGIGIEPDKINKIFNAFEQGQSSITRKFGGLGLGLAISKAMIDAHAGKIRVESPGKDQGSTFSLTMRSVSAPAARGNGQRESPPAVPDKRDGQQRHILVVDDHKDTCIGMRMMLERRGYDVTVAHSADQAVEQARTNDFDLVVSDIGLPDRSGYELMRELHAIKGVPGIALSGFGSEQDIQKARQAGFAEHLTKPINFERLEEAIQALLQPEIQAASSN
jgi:signal transduction histidine kinase/ActR/RegA family two-component response regulator